MEAPERFAAWLSAHEHRDPVYGWVYRYHPRSDAHSVALCRLVLKNFIERCGSLRDHALADKIVYGINAKHVFPNGKKKTLDLAIGTPKSIDGTDLAAVFLDRCMERDHGMPPAVLSPRQTHVPDNADQPSAGDQRLKGALPNPVQLAQKLLIIHNVP
jgi:hypothetical protein